MTDMTQDAAPTSRGGRRMLLVSIVAAAVLGAGAFLAISRGLILSGATEHGDAIPFATGEIAFVPLEPMVISLQQDPENRHLRISIKLEVEKAAEAEVTFLLPRVADVLNSYLQALTGHDVDAPAAMISVRAQLLRRVQLVTGEGRVRDLLISEFVLN